MLLNLKKLIIFSILSLGIFSISSINASEVPSIIEYEDSKLLLNGKGTRIIFFMKVYDGSLYLQAQSNNSEKIVNENSPMAIRIDVTSTMVTADAMIKALNEGLKKSTGNNISPISVEISQLSSSFDSGVSSGDYYEFIYLPKKGTHVIKNNDLVDLIPGLKFKKAFFGIFLSDNPIQKNLKKAMLGG